MEFLGIPLPLQGPDSYDWGEPQETAYVARTQPIPMKTVPSELFEKTALELCPPTKQDIQSP